METLQIKNLTNTEIEQETQWRKAWIEGAISCEPELEQIKKDYLLLLEEDLKRNKKKIKDLLAIYILLKNKPKNLNKAERRLRKLRGRYEKDGL